MNNRQSSSQSFLPPLWILTILGVWGASWVARELKEMLVLLVVGYAIAYVVDPLLDKLEKYKCRRDYAVFIIVAVCMIIGSIVGITVVPALVEDFSRLIDNLPQYTQTLRLELLDLVRTIQAKLPPPLAARLNDVSVDDLSTILSGEAVGKLAGGALKALLQGYSLTLTLVNLLLLPFIVFYLSVDFDIYHRASLRLIPLPYRANVKKLALDIHEHVSGFIQGQLVVGSILTVLYAVGLGAIARIDYWFPLALISGFGNIFPYLGFSIGIVLSSVMSLSTYGDIHAMFWVWGVYVIIQMLEGIVITPRVLGEKVGLSPLAVILSIFAFGKLFGLLGVFLAIPIAGVVRVIGKNLHRWVVGKL